LRPRTWLAHRVAPNASFARMTPTRWQLSWIGVVALSVTACARLRGTTKDAGGTTDGDSAIHVTPPSPSMPADAASPSPVKAPRLEDSGAAPSPELPDAGPSRGPKATIHASDTEACAAIVATAKAEVDATLRREPWLAKDAYPTENTCARGPNVRATGALPSDAGAFETFVLHVVDDTDLHFHVRFEGDVLAVRTDKGVVVTTVRVKGEEKALPWTVTYALESLTWIDGSTPRLVARVREHRITETYVAPEGTAPGRTETSDTTSTTVLTCSFGAFVRCQ
jgi:hypothetical protein